MIIRVQKDKNNPYVIINKGFLNNKKMSWKAKGMLSYLLSLPDDWRINVSDLVNRSKDGEKATYSTIKELVENGYISKDQGREAGGAFGQVNYTVYESPLAGFRDAEKEELLYNNNTNIIKEKINEEENFNLFWNQYSKAIGKKNTVKEWNKLTTEEISEVLTSLPMYLKDRPDKKFRKDPERYLKHKVFKDYLAEPKTKFKDYE